MKNNFRKIFKFVGVTFILYLFFVNSSKDPKSIFYNLKLDNIKNNVNELKFYLANNLYLINKANKTNNSIIYENQNNKEKLIEKLGQNPDIKQNFEIKYEIKNLGATNQKVEIKTSDENLTKYLNDSVQQERTQPSKSK